MKIGIMQPYFFPYIGYWQLINAVDVFVIYDNIQFTKKGWIKKNRIMMNGKDMIISLPIKNDSDYLNINERFLPETFSKDRIKILNQIKAAYNRAPEFDSVFPILEHSMNCGKDNLFDFIYVTIDEIVKYLGINTKILISSSINMDHSLKNKERVISTCKTLGGDQYINPIGGMELYDKAYFSSHGIDLKFIKTDDIEYNQFEYSFISNLSIIDVLMFNSHDRMSELMNCYSLQ